MDENVTEPTPDQAAAAAELRKHLLGLDPAKRDEHLSELIRGEAETILKTPITTDSNFLENGLNSLTALELAKTLIDRVGCEIPMVAIVENPTPALLGHYLSEEVAAEQHPVG